MSFWFRTKGDSARRGKRYLVSFSLPWMPLLALLALIIALIIAWLAGLRCT